MRVAEIEGIGDTYAEALGRAGVTTTEGLLERGATTAGRRELADATGLTNAQILDWVNRADLMRIKGVGSEFSDLLEAAGVDSPVELAHRNPANLAAKFQELVAQRPDIVRRVPGEAEITGWIEQSKALPRVVSHGSANTADLPAGASSMAASTADTKADATADSEPTSRPTSAPAMSGDSASGSGASVAAASGSAGASGSSRGAASSGGSSTGSASTTRRSVGAPTQPKGGLWTRIKRALRMG